MFEGFRNLGVDAGFYCHHSSAGAKARGNVSQERLRPFPWVLSTVKEIPAFPSSSPGYAPQMARKQKAIRNKISIMPRRKARGRPIAFGC
jgi:hypothetical protein